MRKLLEGSTKTKSYQEHYPVNKIQSTKIEKNDGEGTIHIHHSHPKDISSTCYSFHGPLGSCMTFFQALAASENTEITDLERAAYAAAAASDRKTIKEIQERSDSYDEEKQRKAQLKDMEAKSKNKIEAQKKLNQLEIEHKEALFQQRRKHQSPLRKFFRCCCA